MKKFILSAFAHMPAHSIQTSSGRICLRLSALIMLTFIATFGVGARTYVATQVVDPLIFDLYQDGDVREAEISRFMDGISGTENLNLASMRITHEKWNSETQQMDHLVYEIYNIPDGKFCGELYGSIYYSKVGGSLKLPYELKHIGNKAFAHNPMLRGSLEIPMSTQTIGDEAFYGCNFYGTLTFENWNIPFVELKSIGRKAFSYSQFTGELNLPVNLKTIGDEAFRKCSQFTSLTLSPNLESIGNMAFRECTGITSALTLGSKLESIGDEAFWGYTGVTPTLTFGKNMKSIGRQAFWECDGIKSVTCLATTPPEATSPVFTDNVKQNATLQVPIDSWLQYRAAPEWKDFKTYTSDKPDPTSITLNTTTYNIPNILQQYPLQLKAIITPSDAYSHPEAIEWKSSNTSVATVDNIGQVYAGGRNSGRATITATTINGLSAKCEVWVYPYITDISVDPNSSGLGYNNQLNVGESTTLKLIVKPEGSTTDGFTYSSTNPDVLSVDGNGTLTAKASGEATIVITAPSGAQCRTTIKVTKFLEGFNIYLMYPPAAKIKPNETRKLSITTNDDTLIPQIKWSSEDPSVAVVDDNGLVTAIGVGKTKINADAPGHNAYCNITVEPITAESVTVTARGVADLNEGMTLQLDAEVLPANTTDKTVTWSSNDEEVATVDENGLVTARSKFGTATITATCGDISGTIEITVSPILAEKIMADITAEPEEGGLEPVNPDNPGEGLKLAMYTAETKQIRVIVEPDNATHAVEWTSDKPEVAGVNETGLITAVSPGDAQVTAKVDNVSLNIYVAVSSNTSTAIENLEIDDDDYVDIYTTDGIKVYSGRITREEKIHLTPGMYIIITGGKTNKTVIL